MNKPLLTVDQLSLSFSKDNEVQRVLNSVSFELFSGEVLGIVGESGSGKSLTALSIMDLLPKGCHKEYGKLYFEPIGADLWQQPAKQMNKIRGGEIGMIFQEPMTALNPVFRCGEQITETVLQHHQCTKEEAKKKTLDWLEKVGLEDLDRIYKAFPHELSGGQKQRILLAIALCGLPQLLIADEPTTALDVTIQKKILELMLQLKKEEDLSMIFISHDLSVVAEIADRVLVMQQGQIVEAGPTAKVFTQPEHPYTRGLIACKPQLGKSYYRLPTLADFLEGKTKSVPKEALLLKKEASASEGYIRVENLSVVYQQKKAWWRPNQPGLKAVDSVSFAINKGETLGLVGESGCGKSTLAKTLARLIEPASGKILLEGNPIHTFTNQRDFYRKVQIIFQDPYSSLNPRLPVGEAIREPMRVHRIEDKEQRRLDRVVDLLETVGLKADDYKKYPHQFSGGQRQRVSIARALSVNPSFIICDEVVSALDVSVQAIVLNLLKDLQAKSNLTFLFISHDLSVVQFMSDRIAVMKKGEIVELAETQAIYRKAEHPYTQKLIAAIPGQ